MYKIADQQDLSLYVAIKTMVELHNQGVLLPGQVVKTMAGRSVAHFCEWSNCPRPMFAAYQWERDEIADDWIR